MVNIVILALTALVISTLINIDSTLAGEKINVCVEADKQGVRRRSPTNKLDWMCMRSKADQGDAFHQFYVGLSLISGKSSEGKKISEAISLLTAAAKKGQKNAIPVLARLYYAGDEGLPVNIELAYQWASLSEYPIKEDMIIRGSHAKEDWEKLDKAPTIMEKIELIISPEQAEELKLNASVLLK